MLYIPTTYRVYVQIVFSFVKLNFQKINNNNITTIKTISIHFTSNFYCYYSYGI